MKTSDFYYDLPEELIAQDPLEDRSSSRLLVLDKKTGKMCIRDRLKVDYGEDNYVVDPGFNGYSGTDSALDAADWSGDKMCIRDSYMFFRHGTTTL